MPPLSTTQKVLIALGGGLFAIAIYFLFFATKEIEVELPPPEEPVVTEKITEIGRSVEGRPIEAHSFGEGETHVMFVGGIHGGYEWNSVMLAYRFIDHLKANPEMLSSDVKVTVVPSINPDGLYDVVGSGGRFSVDDAPDVHDNSGTGRFNANGVDLNRNFDCKWAPESSWRGETVSAGTAPFSEPEAAALRDLVLSDKPDAVVFWHSQANAVYGSECHGGILPETMTVLNTYAGAAGYTAVPAFTSYPVTGDAEGWLASIGVPAITVELSSHQILEWEKNLAGSTALLEHFSTSLTK